MEEKDEKYSKVALLALITGILAAPPLCMIGTGILAPVAIVSGVVGLGILDRNPDLKGKRWCWAGIIGGSLFILFLFIVILLWSQIEPWE